MWHVGLKAVRSLTLSNVPTMKQQDALVGSTPASTRNKNACVFPRQGSISNSMRIIVKC